MIRCRSLLLVVSAGVLVVALLWHADGAIAPRQPRVDDYAPGEVVVRWRAEPPGSLLTQIQATPASDPALLTGSSDFSVLRVPPGTELAGARMLSQHSEVEWAEPNFIRRAQYVPNDPLFGEQWGVQRIQAPAAWDLVVGSPSVVVAVVDTGVDLRHPDLQGSLVDGRNVLDPDSPPQDDGGHGTHVAGTVAAAINNGVGVSGIAAGVSIMPVKVLRANGAGRDSDVAVGIRWAADNGARVINMSFTGKDRSNVLTEAVSYANRRNAMVVVAAGNERTASPTYPAANDLTIAVAATDNLDRRAEYSSYGDWVDLAAPGNHIWSTYWDRGSTYRDDSGTSMAAPHVTGVIGLLLSLRPGLARAEVEAILRQSADPLTDPGLGAGRVNAARALQVALQTAPTATPSALPGLEPTLVPTVTPRTELTATPTRAVSPTPHSVGVAYNAPMVGNVVYLPGLVRSADSWNTEITIQNLSASPSRVSVDFVEPDGTVAGTARLGLTGAGSGTIAVGAPGFAPPRWTGAGVVAAEGPIAAVVRVSQPGADSMAYEGLVEGAVLAYAPLVYRKLNGWTSTAFVQNAGVDTTRVELVYRSSAGLSGAWSEVASIPPGASRAFRQGETFALPDGFVGSVEIRSLGAQPLVSAVMAVNSGGSAAAYAVRSAGDTELVAPVVFKSRATNGLWDSGIQVLNLGSEPAQLTVSYASSEGLDGAWVESARVPPSESFTFYQPSHDELPVGFVGSATVTVSNGQPVVGVVSEVNYARNVAMVYGLLGGGQPQVYAPLVLRALDGQNSGIQVQNRGVGRAAVTIAYRNAAGALVASQASEIDPGAAWSSYQPSVAGLPDPFIGSATILSSNGQPVAAVVNAVSY